MKYNNDWLISKWQLDEKIKFIFFWGHQPTSDESISKTCFSQWWIAPFEVDGITYKTAEHWMMAEKARLFNDTDILQEILNSNTAAEVKKKGRLIKGFDPVKWEQEKFELVVQGNLHKFSSDDKLKEFLLNTNDRVIVEASPVDAIWGIGLAADDPDIQNPSNWKGENLLGYALMEVRDILKQ
ncbi:MAG: NADAR family protein [Chitinophagaceae bacterium]